MYRTDNFSFYELFFFGIIFFIPLLTEYSKTNLLNAISIKGKLLNIGISHVINVPNHCNWALLY